MRGESPFTSWEFGSANFFRSHRAVASWLLLHAYQMGVRSALSRKLTFPRRLTMTLAQSMRPCSHAHIRGVLPSMSVVLAFAPHSRMSLAISWLPSFAAQCSAETLKASLTGACARTPSYFTSSFTRSSFPSIAANISVVLWSVVMSAGSICREMRNFATSVFPLRQAWCRQHQPFLSLADTSAFLSTSSVSTAMASLPLEREASITGVAPRLLPAATSAPLSRAFLSFKRSPRTAACWRSSSGLLAAAVNPSPCAPPSAEPPSCCSSSSRTPGNQLLAPILVPIVESRWSAVPPAPPVSSEPVAAMTPCLLFRRCRRMLSSARPGQACTHAG
mmetsp:Transcript_40078/g.127568  ORF Transcript_40078/g.127568 Transcript_40078/m.127568 type:complete len:333 (+) Transcript_40078:131-1129(+)